MPSSWHRHADPTDHDPQAAEIRKATQCMQSNQGAEYFEHLLRLALTLLLAQKLDGALSWHLGVNRAPSIHNVGESLIAAHPPGTASLVSATAHSLTSV